MANSKGNAYPTWGIDDNGKIFAVDSSNNVHPKTNAPSLIFYDIGISEDGTLWALASSKPDPDGGGSALFWSDGDGNWTEITTSDPGGVRISGYKGSACIYVTWDNVLRIMDTDGTSSVLYNGEFIHDADYGGGMIWAMLSDKPGEPICLHYATDGTSLDFKAWGNSQSFPQSISAGYQGNCYGVENFSPMYYSKDGSSTGSAGAGADGKTIGITFKNWNYIVLTSGNVEGNDVNVWKDVAGGTYVDAGFKAVTVLSTYFTE